MITKKHNIIFCSVLVLIFFLYCTIQIQAAGGYAGASQRLSLDAKMMSLSGAYDSISDSIESIYYNPAGLTFIKDIALSCAYMPVWDNLTSIYFIGSAVSTKYFPVGIGILNIDTEGIPVRSTSPEISKTITYQDISVYLAFGYTLWPGLSTGLRFNITHKKILSYNGTGIGADISFLWRVENPYAFTKNKFMEIVQPVSFGVIFYNVLPPSITLKESRERYPLEIKNSLSYRFKKCFKFLDPELGLGMNMIPKYSSYVFNMGLDLSLWQVLYLRSGYKVTDKVFTIGTGVKMKNVIVDYGMSSLVVDRSIYTLNMKIFF